MVAGLRNLDPKQDNDSSSSSSSSNCSYIECTRRILWGLGRASGEQTNASATPTRAHPTTLQSAFTSMATQTWACSVIVQLSPTLWKFMMAECGFSWAFSANTWPYARLLPNTYVQQKCQVVLKFNETRCRETERERERPESGTPLANQILRPTWKPNLFMYMLHVRVCVCVCVTVWWDAECAYVVVAFWACQSLQ